MDKAEIYKLTYPTITKTNIKVIKFVIQTNFFNNGFTRLTLPLQYFVYTIYSLIHHTFSKLIFIDSM